MEAFWTASVVVLLVANAAFLVIMLSFARELGMILVRLGPSQARILPSGPSVGSTVADFAVTDLAGKQHHVAPSKYKSYVMIFTSPSCPACSDLLPALGTFSRDYSDRVSTIVISSSELSPQDLDHQRRIGKSAIYSCAPHLHEEFTVDATPYGLLLDSGLQVKAKGVVNSLDQLEGLFQLEGHVLQPAAQVLHLAPQSGSEGS